MTDTGYKIGLVTPFSWTAPHMVNRHVAGLARELTERGHRVTIIAPTADRAAVRQARQRVREVLLDERETLFDPVEPYPRYFFAGVTYPVRVNRATSIVAAPVDLISNVDVLLQAEQLDVLHVHEPFVPGMGWTALRHAGCPLVATFHADSERFHAYWAARPRLQRYFESFDSVIAVSRAARDSASRAFEGEFRIVPDGVDLAVFRAADGRCPGPLRILFVGGGGRRDGLRVMLRALRALDMEAGAVHVDVCGDDRQEARSALLVPAAHAAYVSFHGALDEPRLAELMRQADIVCVPALQTEAFGLPLVQAMASGTALVASDIAGFRELVTDGRDGVLVPPRQPRALARALRTLIEDERQRAQLAAAARKTARYYSWDEVAGRLERVYGEVVRRRKRPRAGVRARPVELYADFHIHSHHSRDCTVSVPEILQRARQIGLDIVAITDHNTLAGGQEGLRLADEYGVRVIAGEEIKTLEGEVIGLFLTRSIAARLSFGETIAAIKAQGGIVYVPHPFDRLHAIPSYATLREHAADIDVLEVFNARLAFPSFNERAERFAQRYRLLAAAGSDAHVLPGLGTALTGMADFSGPDDFLDALADSRIVRRRKSVLYLTSLKFVQTNLEGESPRR